LPDYLLHGSGAANADSVPLRDFVEILFRGRKLMLILAGTFVLAMAAWVCLTPRSYESEMTFLVKNDRADVVVTSGQTMGLQGRQWVDESQVNTEIQLLGSRELYRKVVEICGLASIPGSSRKPTPLEIDKAVRELGKSLVITPVLKANMIKVSYAASNAKEASTVLRALADTYLDRDLKVHSATGTYEFFHSQALYYQDRLKHAQEQLVEFQTPRNAVMLGQQKDLILRKLVDLQATLGESEAAQEENLKRLDDIRTQIAGASPRIQTQTRRLPNQYSVEHLTALVTELENKRTELLTKFQPADRNVKQVEDQIANTRASLERERNGIATEEASDLNPLRQGLEAELAKTQSNESGVRARIGVLGAQIKGYQQRLAELEKSTAAYDELIRAEKESEENYFLYSRKQEEARIADALDRQRIGNVALVDAPSTPSMPHPKITKSTAALMFLGLLLIPCVVLTMGVFRNTVYTSGELEALTELPVLATVPYNKQLLPEAANVLA
jgi:uncharacterized protein involved in exopolysaccharide biosynthesis